MTVGVYGLVAGIVKLDDLGLWLSRKGHALAGVGRGILSAAPWLMKGLAVAGTPAMFLVGGGILVHAVPALHHGVDALSPPNWAGEIVDALCNAAVGVLAGAVVLGAVTAAKVLRRRTIAAP